MQALHAVAAPLPPRPSATPDALPAARLADDLLGWPGTPTLAGCTAGDSGIQKQCLRLTVQGCASPQAFSREAGQHLPAADSSDTTAPSTPSPRPATVRSSDTPSSLHPSEQSANSIAEHLATLSVAPMSTPTPASDSPASECLPVPASWSGRCCWRSMPPSVIAGVMGANHLREVLGHLPMDARHWNQLEQLLEEGRLEMFLIMVYNYLHYEDPTKWNKLEKHVMNPAGYLNKNIGQKVGMLAVCADMVDAMHVLRSCAPETAANVDGRTLQYMFDNLSHSQIRSCCEYLRAVFDQTWPMRCENPRMLLHAKVKAFVAQAHQYDQQQAAAVGHYPATVPPQAPQPQHPHHKLSMMYPAPMGQFPAPPMPSAVPGTALYPHQQQPLLYQQHRFTPKATAGFSTDLQPHLQQHRFTPKATAGFSTDLQGMLQCQ